MNGAPISTGCALCGHPGPFRAAPGDSLREASCPACAAKKRTSALAAVLAARFGVPGRPLADALPRLAPLAIHEAQACGPLHDLLRALPGYTCSEYLDGIGPGMAAADGVRCENLERLSFPDASLDLFITQDVLEHVARPEQALREIQRVLKPGGAHVFTVPVHEGHATAARIRMEGARAVELAPPVYHGDPLRRQQGCLVHTDFGDDLVDWLAALSIPAEMIVAERFYGAQQIPWLADAAAHARYLAAAADGQAGAFLLYNSIVIVAGKPSVSSIPGEPAEFDGERYLPSLDWPEVAFEHWHRYLYATQLAAGKAVLDIACGEGYGSFALAQSAGRVLGVDISAPAIARARAAYVRDNLEFRAGSCVAIPVEGEAVFDLVVSFETIEHLSALEQKMFLAEAKRLLKPDGVLIVSTPNKLLYSDLPGYCNEHHVKEFYVDEFRELLGKRFAHVALLGQKVYPASYIWSETGAGGRFSEYGLEYGDGQFQPGTGAKKMLYAIALCSDAELAAGGASVLLDLSERMLAFIKQLEGYGARLAAQLDAARARIETLERQLSGRAAEPARSAPPVPEQPASAQPPAPAEPAIDTHWRGERAVRQLGIKLINLDRRPDRMAAFRAMLAGVADAAFCERVERYAAVDGASLVLTPEIEHAFRGNDFGYRRSFIGCAQSHLALWAELAAGERPAYLILEDDATLCRGFERKLAALCDQLEQRDGAYDLVLLGYSDWQPEPAQADEPPPQAVPFEAARYLGGLFAYLVSRRGARRLLAIAGRDGIRHGIDRFVHVNQAELELLMAAPVLARSPLAAPGAAVDSDIQYDFETLPDPGPRP